MYSKIFGKVSDSEEEINQEQNINYEELINNNTIEEIKKIHEENPLNSKILSGTLLNVSDVDKFIFLCEDLKINTNFEMVLDIAIENGNFPLVEYLVKKGIKYSLIAKQMAMINGYMKIVLYVETFGNKRNKIGINNVYREHTKNGIKWSSCIPVEYQFF